jgi:hypothetical protein
MMDYQMPFVPFQRDKHSYVLPKVSRSSADPAVSECPIPPPELRLGYGRSTEEYLANGQRHVQTMLALLRAGGRLYVTIHDRHSIQLLTHALPWREVPFAAFLRQHQDYAEFAHTNFAMFTLGRATESQVFYDVESLCERLHGLFKVLSVTEEAYGYQTAILLEKP